MFAPEYGDVNFLSIRNIRGTLRILDEREDQDLTVYFVDSRIFEPLALTRDKSSSTMQHSLDYKSSNCHLRIRNLLNTLRAGHCRLSHRILLTMYFGNCLLNVQNFRNIRRPAFLQA